VEDFVEDEDENGGSAEQSEGGGSTEESEDGGSTEESEGGGSTEESEGGGSTEESEDGGEDNGYAERADGGNNNPDGDGIDENSVDANPTSDAGSFDPDDYTFNSGHGDERRAARLAPHRLEIRQWLGKEFEQTPRIFHIMGKPGSGKSVCLKFLQRSPAVSGLLAAWAGEKKLIRSWFYFWKPSPDRLLNTMDGMVRSLLIGMLSQEPTLMTIACPDILSHGGAPSILMDSAVESAFERLLESDVFQEKYRTIFFIDGLDEFVGSADRLRGLLQKLALWSCRYSTNLKICVSSREAPVFEQELLPTALRFQLQLLTSDDIRHYVKEKFHAVEAFRSMAERDQATLVREVSGKAEGVFLWTHLVMADLEETIACGADAQQARARIEQIPKDLDDLFRSLYAMIAEPDQTALKFIVRIRAILKRARIPWVRTEIPLFLYFYLDRYISNARFALRMPVTPSDGGDDRDSCLDQARKRLYIQTRGIFEVRDGDDNAGLWPVDHSSRQVVMFTHRSVSEFLHGLGGWYPNDDSVVDAVLQATLAYYKRSPQIKRDVQPVIPYTYELTLESCLFNIVRTRDHFQSLNRITSIFALRGRPVFLPHRLRHGMDLEYPVFGDWTFVFYALYRFPIMGVGYIDYLMSHCEVSFGRRARSLAHISLKTACWVPKGQGVEPTVLQLRHWIRLVSLFLHERPADGYLFFEDAELFLTHVVVTYLNGFECTSMCLAMIELLIRHGVQPRAKLTLSTHPGVTIIRPQDDLWRQGQEDWPGFPIYDIEKDSGFCVPGCWVGSARFRQFAAETNGAPTDLAALMRRCVFTPKYARLEAVFDMYGSVGGDTARWAGHSANTCPECNGKWVLEWVCHLDLWLRDHKDCRMNPNIMLYY
jgi:hypothetical protein